MSYKQRSIGKIGDFLPTVNQENLDESLAEIRQAAKEYYAGKSKPKIDLDIELFEDEARFRREEHIAPRVEMYSSGLVKMVPVLPRVDLKVLKRFVDCDMKGFDERLRDALAKKIYREYPPDRIILDEIPTESPIIPSFEELKKHQHILAYGEWSEPTEESC